MPGGKASRSPVEDVDVTQLIGELRRQAVAKSGSVRFAIAHGPESGKRGRSPREKADGSLAPFDADLRSLLRFDGAEFVRKSYLKVLGRRPDPAGAAFFLSRLRGGWGDKIGVLQALRYSAEGKARGTRVRGLRVAIFLRYHFTRPDVFLNDLMRHEGDAFIQNAYRQLLGRPADAGGYASQSALLQGGWVGKIRVLASLRYSPEGRTRNIRVGGLGIAVMRKNLYVAAFSLPRRAMGMILRRSGIVMRSRRARRSQLTSISRESGTK